MAYALRYYKEVPQRDGGTIRLEIYKKDSTAGAIEIGGVVRSLALEIQGQQGDIDTPIVKTSLSMSFVDAQDIENGKKNGFWEEFYTPDAVLWQVVLKAKDAKESTFRTIWGGYVTPDSFSESLVYRGDVTIIARDNIGHLQDFSFDAQGNEDGQITLYDLVSAAWAKIESPMGLDFSNGNWLMCDGVPAYNTRLNVSAFEGMNWYQAIEKALYAYGLVMRYRGENNVMVCSLRDMTKYGQYSEDYLPHLEPKFVTGATRELVPAVKKIEEKTEYELEDSMIMPQVTESDYSGKIETTSLSTSSGVSFVLYDWHISNKEDGKGWKDSDKPIYFNPSGYDVTEVVESKDNEYMWLSSSAYIGGPLRYSEFNKYFNASKLNVEMSFGSVYRLVSGALKIVGESAVFPSQVALGVYVDDGYTERWLDAKGEWVSTQQTLTVALENGKMSLPIPLDAYSGKVLLGIRVYSVASTWELDVYTPLYSLTLHEDAILRATNTVNTVLNDSNNVVLSRKPELASAFDNVALPGVIKNGIFYKKGDVVVPAHSWAWSGGTPQQMSVYNHLQLLAYFAKPFNLISGTIVNADLTRVATLFVWGGSEHVLVSGRYNFLSGHIESAQLRGFYRYENLWSEVSGVSAPDVEEGTQNNIDKKSSSSNASTYTATQTVNIGTGGGGGASSLNDLQDVDTTGVTANCVLYFNGTHWVEKNVDNLLEDYVKRSTLESLWKIDPQTGRLVTTHPVEIGNNLIVRGESASGGGAGQPSVAGIIGIRVNGHTYYDKDDGVEDGIIDLGTISGGGGGDIDLSAYLTKTAAAQTYLPLAGGTISGANGALEIKRTSTNGLSGIKFSNESGVLGYIGIGGSGSDFPLQPTFYTGSTSYALIHSGNIEKQISARAYGLKTNEIANVNDAVTDSFFRAGFQASNRPDGNSNYASGLTIYNDTLGYTYQLAFSTANALYSRRKGANGWESWKTIAFTDSTVLAANKLATSSGTVVTASGTTILKDYNSRNFFDAGKSAVTGYNLQAFGDGTTDNITVLQGGKATQLKCNGSIGLILNNHGNVTIGDSDYAGTSAKLYVRNGDVWVNNPNGESRLRLGGNTYMGRNADFAFIWNTDNTHPISFGTNSTTRMLINPSGNVLIGTTEELRSGTKLQVSGYAFATRAWLLSGDYGMWRGSTFSGSLVETDVAYNATKHAFITGNVLIGATTDSGYKLDVNGTAIIRDNLSIIGGKSVFMSANAEGIYMFASGIHWHGSNNLYAASLVNFTKTSITLEQAVTMSSSLDVTSDVTTSTRFYAPYIFLGKNSEGIYVSTTGISWHNASNSYANTLITFAADHVLFSKHVTMSSNATINGNLIVKGESAVGSDVRYKDRIEDVTMDLQTMANAPLFTFRWKDREDKTVYLGTSAQYWEEHRGELVQGEDFKVLNYASLGVAMGISLAKKALDHEQRIKVLEDENKRLNERLYGKVC